MSSPVSSRLKSMAVMTWEGGPKLSRLDGCVACQTFGEVASSAPWAGRSERYNAKSASPLDHVKPPNNELPTSDSTQLTCVSTV